MHLTYFQAEQGKSEIDDVTEVLQAEKRQLQEKIDELEEKARQVDRRNTEIRLAEQKKYEDEMQFLRRTNQQLKVIFIFIDTKNQDTYLLII